MEQLEFDLWVDERVSDLQLVKLPIHSRLFWLLQRRDVQRFYSPNHIDTVLRYRV